MRAKRSGTQADEDAGEVVIRIEQRDGCEFMVVEDRGADAESAGRIAIPVAQLPELKRTIERLETGRSPSPGRRVAFAHSSEEEFARILDFYGISWEYEPATFPLEWDRDGRVSSSFTPDFYLPDHKLYIEITTLRQALVTRKNRKIRRMRELYPNVNVKVLYASDYRKIVEKFLASGRLGKARAREQNKGPE